MSKTEKPNPQKDRSARKKRPAAKARKPRKTALKYPLIRREADGSTVVQDIGRDHLLNEQGVTCLNPDAEPAKRIYQKRFIVKEIWLPEEYEACRAKYLNGKNLIALGGNGYSSLKPSTEKSWGVKPGGYFKACEVMFTKAYRNIRKNFPDSEVVFIHGAGPGVDEVISQVSRKQRSSTQLGFNCPEFMFYVPDDDVPVYVAKDKAEYADAFVRSCDILIAANGRLHAFEMDYMAVMKHHKKVVLVNVLKKISKAGGPPPCDADGKINDAVAHFYDCLRMVGVASGIQASNDPWKDTIKETNEHITQLCREILDPDLGLEIPDDD